MVLELSGETEMEGHVSGQNCTDNQLPNLLHCTHKQCFRDGGCLHATAC